MAFETQKIKLIVALLTMATAVDGLLKVSANSTMLSYHLETKYYTYCVTRIVTGALLTLWAYFGLCSLFYDNVKGIVIYSTGMLLLTVGDIGTLILKLTISKAEWDTILDTDEFSTKIRPSMVSDDSDDTNRGFAIKYIKQDIIQAILCWLFLISQIATMIFGLFLARRLQKHQDDEEQYHADLARLHELRKQLQNDKKIQARQH